MFAVATSTTVVAGSATAVVAAAAAGSGIGSGARGVPPVDGAKLAWSIDRSMAMAAVLKAYPCGRFLAEGGTKRVYRAYNKGAKKFFSIFWFWKFSSPEPAPTETRST